MANVLIVEDEPIAVWSIREALEELGHVVVGEAASGQEAVSMAQSAQPDLVLMDIYLLGELDGIETAEVIQAELSIPVIYLTAYADEKMVQRAMKTSPFGYLVKPFRSRELQTSIAIALHRYHQEKNLESAESQLVKTLESLGDGTITTDTAELVNFINPMAANLIGCSRQQALGQTLDQVLILLDGQTQAQVSSPLRQAFLLEEPDPSQDYLLRTWQGQIRFISLSVAIIKNQQGQLLGGVLSFRDITERKQLEQRLRQQAERERILNDVALGIRHSLELEVVLATTTEEIRQLLQVNRVLIYRFDPDWSGTVVSESLEGSYPSMLGVSLADPCLAMTSCLDKYREGYVQVLPDTHNANLSDCYVGLLDRFKVQANLVVPIVSGQKNLWGLLTVQHCAAPRPWSGWEVDLIRQLTLQVGIAIQQSQLYQQSQRQAKQEALLNEMVQVIRNSLNWEEVLNQAAASLLNVFQASRSTLRLGRDTDETFAYSVAATVPGMASVSDQSMPIVDNPLVQATFFNQGAIAVTDVEEEPWLQPLLPFFKRNHIRSIMAVAIRYEGRVKGMACLHQCDRTRQWHDDEKHLLVKAADQLAITLQQVELYRRLHRANQELKRLAHLDGLTQVANRRLFDEYLETEYRRQQRSGSSLALILCDVDFFKRFNDTYGHLVGDDCLKLIAQTLARVLKRPGDLAARFGGEEFAIVLPNTDLAGAITVAEDILAAVRQIQIDALQAVPLPQVTVSMGLASLEKASADGPETLIAAADQALYRAKREGRDRYCLPLQPALQAQPD